MRNRNNVISSALLLAAVIITVAPARIQAKPSPGEFNVLLVSLDTLRADHLSCYGYSRKTSPNMDRLAAEGVLFENLTAASSWTIPSHMSMFTSLYPSAHGVETSSCQLAEGVPMLAEILKKHGYTTAGFVTGPSLNHKFGFSRGFDFYDDFTVTLMHETNLFAYNDTDNLGINQVPTNHIITNLACKWLQKNRDKRFFLFVHYWDIHNDYIPPPPYDQRFDPGYEGKENGRNVSARQKELERAMLPDDLSHLIALYDGEIAHTDAHVGKLLKALLEMELSRKTIVIVTADHGEGFLEHGKLHHGNTLFEEVIHVPLLLRLPGVIPKGKRIKGNVSHVDFMPTILGLLRLPAQADIHGIDLSQMVLGRTRVPDRIIFSELNLKEKLRTVRQGTLKLIGKRGAGDSQLLQVTRHEEKVVTVKNLGEEFARRKRLLSTAFTAGPPPAAVGKAKTARRDNPDKKLIERLRSLGYMQ